MDLLPINRKSRNQGLMCQLEYFLCDKNNCILSKNHPMYGRRIIIPKSLIEVPNYANGKTNIGKLHCHLEFFAALWRLLPALRNQMMST